MLPLPRRHAWLAGPPANTCPRNNPQNKRQHPPHRHSGIFRVADLGPGTMPRGKYPESPAPAGSHALISRTPTPGGMLHANLGPPRPPPRNFQPPLPRFPSRLSPRRMSGTTAGRILSHPLPWSRPPSCNRPQNKRQQHPNHRHSGIFRRGEKRGAEGESAKSAKRGETMRMPVAILSGMMPNAGETVAPSLPCRSQAPLCLPLRSGTPLPASSPPPPAAGLVSLSPPPESGEPIPPTSPPHC